MKDLCIILVNALKICAECTKVGEKEKKNYDLQEQGIDIEE